ncbi:hypothetical protein O6H91_12G026000 [Diphasiastrum complanatum]|uniref:Uncharacterized protein n=2 Tax=Diphasiastrum complanatum TaxID=34168 RepID=A0ACC2BZS9_DIPCM|nr:hypothetical protein O6H91_12G026000 [Diphasiastrum complanatum]
MAMAMAMAMEVEERQRYRLPGDGDFHPFHRNRKQRQRQNQSFPTSHYFPGQKRNFYPRNRPFHRELAPALSTGREMGRFTGKKHCFRNLGARPSNQRMYDLGRKPSLQNGPFGCRRRWIDTSAVDDRREEWWQRKRQKMHDSGCGFGFGYESRFGCEEAYEWDAEVGARVWPKQQQAEGSAGGRAVQEDCLSSVSAQRSTGSYAAFSRQKPEVDFGFHEQEQAVVKSTEVDSIRDQRFPLDFEISSSKQSDQANQRSPLSLEIRKKQEPAEASAAERAAQEDCITSAPAQASPGSYSASARQKLEANLFLNKQENRALQATEMDCTSDQLYSPDLEVSSLIQCGQANQWLPVYLERKQEQAEDLAVERAVQENSVASVSAQLSPGVSPASARQTPEADFCVNEQENPVVQATETDFIASEPFALSLETSSSKQNGQAAQRSGGSLEIWGKQEQAEVSAVGRAVQGDCGTSVSARLSAGSYPASARQKLEAYFGFPEQEKAVSQATETDGISNQRFSIDLEMSSLKQSDQATQSFSLNSEVSPSKQSAQGTDDRCPDDKCNAAAALATTFVVFRKKRFKPIAIRSWGNGCILKTLKNNKSSENDHSLSQITEPAEDRPPWKGGGHAGVLLTEERLGMHKQADIDRFKPKHLESDKLPHSEKRTAIIVGGVSGNSPPMSKKQRSGGYRCRSSLVGWGKSIVETESNGSETGREDVDVISSAYNDKQTQPEDGFLGKEALGSSSALMGKPLYAVSEEFWQSDSGSSMMKRGPDSCEVPTSVSSQYFDAIISSPDSKITEDKVGLAEKQPGCSNSSSTLKPVPKHLMFKRPVAIKSKNCYEVVKRKTILLDSSSDENEAFSKQKCYKKWASRDVASKLHRIRLCLSSKEWNVKERSTRDSNSESKFKEDEEDEIRSLFLETLKKFDRFRRKASQDRSDSRSRSDLKAGMLMKKYNLRINEIKRVGSVPGIEVGDQFFFRIEMLVVGLHMQVQAGIDFIVAKESQYNEPVAVSIVASVGYDYDLNDGDTLIYTGQGGNAHKDEKFLEDQKLVRGNLALSNSHRHGLPVRVIRCYDRKNKKSEKIYTYDGLYKIDKVWDEKGRSGFLVYKFCLQRLPGQPRLVSPFALSSSFQG